MIEKHRKFCEEYAKGATGIAAYLKVYTKASKATAQVNSCKLLKLPEIKEYVEAVREGIKNRAVFSSDEIMSILKEVATDTTVSKLNRLKACEIASKCLGMQTGKIEHSGKIDGNFNVTHMTDEEIEQQLLELSDDDEE